MYHKTIIQGGRIRIPLTGLTPPHVSACHKPAPGFPTLYVVVPPFFVQCIKVRGDCLFC
jgi:hypothetical protein